MMTDQCKISRRSFAPLTRNL